MTVDDLVDEFTAIHRRLKNPYMDYCVRVSPRSMALSIETCTFAYWLCSTRYAKRPADFGSGFSSFTLRTYAESVRGKGTLCQVTSVDDSREWLARTGEFMKRYGFSPSGLMMWDDWEASDLEHDLIVYDFGKGEVRERCMIPVVDRLAPGGMILFDDANHPSHIKAMMAAIHKFGLEPLDVRDATLDGVGRFALAAVKPE